MKNKPKKVKDTEQAARMWLDENTDQKKATIKDVAAIAGVSKNTISRIINNSPLVKDKTRDDVRKIIEIVGYIPDPQARGLAFRHSFLVGMVYGSPNPQYVLNLQQGILDGLNQTDYELVVHPCDKSTPDYLANARRFIERQKLAGVIVTPPLAEDEEFTKVLQSIGCAYVRIAPIKLDDDKHILVTHDREGARAAIFHLAALGHLKIGFISGRDEFLTASERFEGFKEGMIANNLSVQSRYIAKGDFTFNSGVEAAKILLSQPEPPTAIFAANDEMAAGALLAIRLVGLRSPDDVSVVGFDDFHIAETVWPRLTTLKSPTRQIGKTAANMLLNTTRSNEVDIQKIDKPTLVMRDSTTLPKSK